MITVFKKIEKNKENLLGIKEIQNVSELEKPFLLCISAQDMVDKSVYGIVKIGAQSARVNTNEEMASGFRIDEFPVDFLGVKFKKDKDTKKEKELLDMLIIPYLFNSEDKSVDYLEKRARNINIMTYCDGTLDYIRLEKLLVERLEQLGYSREYVERIVSQISLTAIGTIVDTSELIATTMKFVDVNDDEISNDRTYEIKKELNEKRKKSTCVKETKSNDITYYYDGSGEHELREYLTDGVLVKPVLCSVVSYFLNKSIQNEKKSSEDLMQLYEKFGNENLDPRKLMDYLDRSLRYNGAPKYTESEAKLRKELDESYSSLFAVSRDLVYKAKSNDENERKVSGLVESIKEFSSETTFYQIMGKLGLWNVTGDYSELPSDKEIRELYESSLDKPKMF